MPRKKQTEKNQEEKAGKNQTLQNKQRRQKRPSRSAKSQVNPGDIDQKSVTSEQVTDNNKTNSVATVEKKAEEKRMGTSSKQERSASVATGEDRSQYSRKGKQDLHKLGEVENIYGFSTLQEATNSRLIKFCKELQVEISDSKLKKLPRLELIKLILKQKSTINGFDFVYGSLDPCESNNSNYGFLRLERYSYAPSPEDIYISGTQIKKFGLRKGDTIAGQVRERRENEKHRGLVKIDAVNWQSPEKLKERPNFDSLTPTYPDEKFNLEQALEGEEKVDITLRVIDLFTPMGKGQRGLIVAPPRTGKTIILQKIAKSISQRHPDSHLMILLVDERPEEVTEMREIVPDAEIISSCFDQTQEHHIQVSEMVIENAKRQVEFGKDVVILLDSITRMTRAYNVAKDHSGKILSGGLDAFALQKPKQFFGAARNIQGGGSLTIMATALINTGSRMDDVIYEEFKGTGNLEMVLARNLADRRMFPAIDINLSGTRREELLLDPAFLGRMHILRKVLNDTDPIEAMEMLLKRMHMTKNNAEFLNSLQIKK